MIETKTGSNEEINTYAQIGKLKLIYHFIKKQDLWIFFYPENQEFCQHSLGPFTKDIPMSQKVTSGWHRGGEGVMKKWRHLCMWKNTQFFQQKKKHHISNMVLFSKRIPSKIGFWNAQHHIANMIFVFLLKKLCIFPHTEGTSLFHDPLPPLRHLMSSFCEPLPPPHMGDVLCERPLCSIHEPLSIFQTPVFGAQTFTQRLTNSG